MGTFTPIAMKCTQEQFEAIKPKLKGFKINSISCFKQHHYLINFYHKTLSNINIHNTIFSSEFKEAKKIYEEWNEEIFLKACGIEVESLEQQLQKAESEVKRLKEAIEEENNIKIGDWVKRTYKGTEFFKADESHDYRYINSSKFFYHKITNKELIKLLENE